ncbi:MAG: DUF1854 domain-containing protein [Clostridia bacterium]|nr:DUF1854 domain-containing protein [Clostridia bacterium]
MSPQRGFGPPPGGMPPGMEKPRRKMGIGKFTDIVYLLPENITFYKTKGGLIGAKTKDYDGRANLFRIFPLNLENKYISVRDKDLTELGIIEDMEIFPQEQIELMNDELNKRYFIPKITKVIEAKEEFGNYFWNVETTAGERKFSMRDLANNVIHKKNGAIVLVDVDGSRYEMEDVYKTAGKALKFLDIWL